MTLLRRAAVLTSAGLLALLSMSAPNDARAAPQANPDPGATPKERAARTDVYGDPLPDGMMARLGTVRFSVPGQLNDLNFSPDGKYLAGAGEDGSLALWDPRTGKELRRLVGSRQTRSFHGGFAFSRDGKFLAELSLNYDPDVHVWDVAAGKPLVALEAEYFYCQMAFSPDGKTLAVSGERSVKVKDLYERVHDAVLWDAATGKERYDFGEADPAVAFAPSGDTVATCRGPSLFLWDAATGKRRREIAAGRKATTALAFAPDGKTLASAGADGVISFWDPETGKEVHRLTGHDAGVSFLRFTAGGKRLVSRGGATAVVWDAKSGERLRSVKVPKRPWDGPADLAPGGETFAAGDGANARLYDLSTGQEKPAGPVAACQALAFFPDGKTVVTGGVSSSGPHRTAIQIWDAASGRLLREWDAEMYATEAAVSPDGRTVAAEGWSRTTSGAELRFWDAESGRPLAHAENAPDDIRCLTFAADGKGVAFVGHKGVFTADAATGRASRAVGLGDLRPQEPLAYAADARLVAVGLTCRDGAPKVFGGPGHEVLYLIDAASGKVLREFGGPFRMDEANWVDGIRLSPDGRLLASGKGDSTPFHLWETATGKELPLSPPIPGPISGPAFSPDGAFLTVCGEDHALRLVETASGKEVRRFQGSWDRVDAVAFSRDGETLAFDGGDGTVLLYDLSGRDSRPAADPGRRELEQWADELRGEDAARAFAARQKLAAVPKQSAPLMLAALRAPTPPSPRRLARLIAGLGADDFQAREDATAELAALGTAAETTLQDARAASPSAEAAQRLDGLLKELENAKRTERTRRSRAVAVLEHSHAPEALEALRELAKGPAYAPATEQAKAALARLRVTAP